MEKIAKDILKHLKNEHTKVERKQGFIGNYYSPLIDTIYIAENFENSKYPEDTKNINKKAAELITVCHECLHSIQNKYLHILNTICANLSIIMAIICILISLFWTSSVWLKLTTATILIVSIIVRLILEVGAINGSVKLAKVMIKNEQTNEVSKEDIEESEKYISKYKLQALAQMVLDKIIFFVLVLSIK